MKAVAAPELPGTTLNADTITQLTDLARGLTPAELYWVAAWSAARATQLQRGEVATVSPVGVKATSNRLTIVYGSQTGNAKRVAEQLVSRSEAAGIPVRLLRAGAYPTRELAQERYLVIVVSTQGEGEPPDDARGFVEFVLGKRVPKLASLQFSVLALGDSSYPLFCATGRQLDERLQQLGATRFTPLAEADVDLETVATPWLEDTLSHVRDTLKTTQPAGNSVPLHAVPARAPYSRERPFAATVLSNQPIVARGSEREIRHIELSLQGSGLSYAPGDALGVWPQNPSALVRQWLSVLNLDGALEVSHRDRTLTLAQWLGSEREITRLSRAFIVALAAVSNDSELALLLQPERAAALADVLAQDQPIDLLRRYPATWQAEALVSALRPLTPRLYSIASSQKLVGDEVHVTLAVVDYEAHGDRRVGAASSFLASIGEDGTVPVFIESNDRFRLPADASRDVIMIGPGTGVAPFRAFVQEQQERQASGRNWLFFGNRHFSQDFLYQVEWQTALKEGALHRLDLGFSRDAADKIYVQQRMREQGRELNAWLENGAYLYVCGDATQMAKDVHAALIEIISTHGGRSTADAENWLADLMQQGRYARDVY